MWGPAFRPWLEERILADDDEVLVVDKPSGVVVHGGDEELETDVVRRLKAYLLASGRNAYLGVHQRLDVGTSGVLAFVRIKSQNAAVGADFESGRARKRYLAAVAIGPRSPLARKDSAVFEHRLAASPDGGMRVTRSGGLECRAECRVLARREERALVELVPETGRTHQLRVQLSASDAPIAGDRDYGGPKAPRLLLHANALELPSLARSFVAEEPALLRRWVNGDVLALGPREELRRRLRDAACLRYPLIEHTHALRWVNGAGDELSGVTIDLYAGYATLAVSSPEAVERAQEIADELAEQGALGVYLKVRARADVRRLDAASLAPSAPISGSAAPSELVVREGPLKLRVDLADGASTGLFVDQRDNRGFLQANSRGAVLNLFSYTCSFSLAAAKGGALRVVSVDTSRRALERGEDNFRANGVDPARFEFVHEDVLRYLRRARARREVFDFVVLDPPSFSTSKQGRVLRAGQDYAALVELVLGVLRPGGRLLAVTNHRGTSRARLRRLVQDAVRAAGRDAAQLKDLGSGLDCPDGPDGPEPSKAVLLTLG